MSKPFDATSKDILEAGPAGWVTYLGYRTTDDQVTVIDADVSTITAFADKVLRIAVPSPWLRHVEFQSSRDDTLGRRLPMYNTILGHRHDLPVATVVFLLRPEAACQNLHAVFPHERRWA
jgi:hypothetical protein